MELSLLYAHGASAEAEREEDRRKTRQPVRKQKTLCERFDIRSCRFAVMFAVIRLPDAVLRADNPVG